MENYLPIGTWNLLPSRWMGREASIAMIMEWITEAQINAAHEIQRRLDEGDQMAAMADPTRDMLEDAIQEARNYGYAQRCITELSTLSNTPDKERGSILSTAFAGINVFKNQAVKARTSFSDIQFKDLRGMKDPVTGEWKPISVYLSVNQVDARALGVISSTFIEVVYSYHEQYFHKDYLAWQSDYAEKVMLCARMLHDAGYRYIFFADLFGGK